MSTATTRLELTIDVVGLPGQRALAMPGLTPPELIAAVLAEFGELEHLGPQPAAYRLIRVADGAALDGARTLGEQIATGEHLALTESEPPLPEGAARPRHALYLREQASGQVFRLGWLPALIGRSDPELSGEPLLAVNLEAHAAGLRVSRRHAQLIARDNQYLIERLSPNPIVIIDGAGQQISVEQSPTPIQGGDTLLLERSQIALTFLVREHTL